MIGKQALNAYNDSIRRTVPEVVDDLRVALGAKLVAYIAGVSETRTVREWAEAARRPTRWGIADLLDKEGGLVNHDVNGEPIDVVIYDMMDEQVDDGDMIRSFGVHSITKLDDSISLDCTKLEGYSARVVLKRAPRTLR